MEKIIIHNLNETYVKVECKEDLAYELREAFRFKVPGFQFTPQYRSRMWSGDIFLFNIRTKQIYRGLVQNIQDFCTERDYSFEYENTYNENFSLKEAGEFIQTLDLPKELTPRDYQVEAFVHSIRNKRCLLLSPTASGKSLIIYLILQKIQAKRALVIVPTLPLVHQMTSDFEAYGMDTDDLVHKVYGGQDKYHKSPITISTWQSLFEMPRDFFKKFDVVIGDEAHLFKAKSLCYIMESLVNAEYRIGTTGTLDGTKTNKLVLEGLFGPVKKVTTTKELMDQKHVANFEIKCILLKHNDAVCKALSKSTYQEEIEYLVLNETRNKFIKNLALSLNGNTLILYQYVEKHGAILYDMINKECKNRKVFFIHGKVDGEDREEVRHIVETEKDAIIIASYGTMSTGTNIKNLHNLIFASPSKSRIRNLQSIGRALRVSNDKTHAVLFDIADNLKHKKHENYTLNHFLERIKIYAEEKFEFKIYKVNLG